MNNVSLNCIGFGYSGQTDGYNTHAGDDVDAWYLDVCTRADLYIRRAIRAGATPSEALDTQCYDHALRTLPELVRTRRTENNARGICRA